MLCAPHHIVQEILDDFSKAYKTIFYKWFPFTSNILIYCIILHVCVCVCEEQFFNLEIYFHSTFSTFIMFFPKPYLLPKICVISCAFLMYFPIPWLLWSCNVFSLFSFVFVFPWNNYSANNGGNFIKYFSFWGRWKLQLFGCSERERERENFKERNASFPIINVSLLPYSHYKRLQTQKKKSIIILFFSCL